jgi:hypothetical protein
VRHRKTDYGTIILHWLLVAAFAIALLSGLRIATEAPGRGWINLFDAVLPRGSVWVAHMQASVALVALSLAYTIYLIRSGLSRRIRLDKVRLHGLFGRKQARLGAFNIILYWVFFATMLALIASGGLLYFGIYAGYDVAMLHWYGTWIMLAFSGLHVLAHYRLGGASQLLRIIRPTHLPAPPPKLDAIELLTLLAEQSARLSPESGPADATPSRTHVMQARRETAGRGSVSKRKSPTLQSNPFVVAAAVAITGASFIVAADRLAVDRLQIHRINSADAPILDGDTSDSAWRNIAPFSLMTSEGANFDGKGETRIQIRAVHDGTWAYFLFTWEDPTRSLKHRPLVREVDGWHLLHDGHEAGDEHEYNDDKFAALLTTSDTTLAGDRTFHASPSSIPGAPASLSGRGLHFTTGDYVDVWQWNATRGGGTGWMDDAHFGPPLDPTPMQTRNIVPYKGGFAPDPGAANYTDNFVLDAVTANEGNRTVVPLRLPKDLAATEAAMGKIDLDPNHGESEGARWFMTEQESVPYSIELDTRVPTGTVIPGVIVAGQFSGDRADIRCAARWAAGHWALEVARRLDTHSRYDVPIRTGIFMRVAAFDHSEIAHTRHVRPIRLEVE